MPFLRFFHVCGDNHENSDDDDDHVEDFIFRRIVLHNRVIESWRKENEKAKEGPRHQGVDCHDYYLGNNCVTEIVTAG